jgi:ABC-type glycerol-3-phosphate transport system substrate-binding protein
VAVSSTTPYAEEAYKFARWWAQESGQWKVSSVPTTWTDIKREYRAHLAEMYSWPDAVAEMMAGPTTMEPGVGAHYDELNDGWTKVLSAVAANQMAPREAAQRLVEHTTAVLKGDK